MNTFLVTLFTTVGSAGAMFASNVIYARLLGPGGRGELAAVILVVSTIAMISQFGLAKSIGYQHRIGRTNKTFILACSLLVATCALLLALPATRYLKLEIETGYLFWMALLASVLMFLSQLSQAYLGLKIYNFNRLFPGVSLAVVLAIFYILEVNDLAYIYLTIVITSIPPIVLTSLYIYSTDSTSPVKVRADGIVKKLIDLKFCKDSISYYLMALIGSLSYSIDKLYMYFTSSSISLGLYTTAFGLSRVFGYINDSLSAVVYSRFVGAKNESELDQILNFLNRVILVPALALATILAFFSERIVVIIFGSDFAGAASVFSVLIFESIISSTSWVISQKFTTSGSPHIVLIRQSIALLFLIGSLFFVRQESLGSDLAYCLLGASIVRYGITYWICKAQYGILLQFIPTSKDILFIKQNIFRIGR